MLMKSISPRESKSNSVLLQGVFKLLRKLSRESSERSKFKGLGADEDFAERGFDEKGFAAGVAA